MCKSLRKTIKAKLGKEQAAFTILEITVVVSLFVLIIMLTSSLYLLSQRAYRKGSNRGELTQNIRVSLDRMSREIRQAVDIVTILPTSGDNPEDPPMNELFFQDGHEIEEVTYIYYYLSSTDLKRSHIAYYFPEEPGTYVTWDSTNQSGEPPEELIIKDRIVGEYFDTLEFWGIDGLVYINLGLSKSENNLSINTAVFMRN